MFTTRRAQQAVSLTAPLGGPTAVVAGARTGHLQHGDDLALELVVGQRWHVARLAPLCFLLFVLVPAAGRSLPAAA